MEIESHKLKELSDWDFPDTKYVPDGYDMTSVAIASDANFQKLLEEHNKLVEVVNGILDCKVIVRS